MRFSCLGLACCVLYVAVAAAQTPPIAAVPTDAEIRRILMERIDGQKQSVGIVVGVIDPHGRGRGNVGALVTHHAVVRRAASGGTSDTIPERTPQVGSRALHNGPAAIDVRPLPTNAWFDVCPSAD
jgi:hypothetical protein